MSNPSGEDKSVSELEADIARTRAQLGRDVEGISYKLSPDRLKEQAQGTLQDAQEAVMDTVNEMTETALERTKEAGSSFIDMIRRHPLPTALIGAGVALLAAGGGIGASRARDDDDTYVGYGNRYGYGEGDYSGYVRPGYGSEPSASTGHLGEPYKSGYQGSGASRSFESYGAYDSGYDTGSYNPEGGGTGAGYSAGYNASSYDSSWSQGEGRSFGSRASAVGEQAKGRSQDAGRGITDFIEEQPLVAGLLTVVLGALIGLGLPGTRQEDKLMGGARDHLAEQARGVAERAREAAQKTFDEAKESAKQEFSRVQEDVKAEGKNLFAEGKDALKKVAEDVKETAQSEASKIKPS